jgi:hypothetical protein
MTPDRFQLLSQKLFPTLLQAAEFMRIEYRMYRRMASGKQRIPHAVALVLEIMTAYDIKPADLADYDFGEATPEATRDTG